MLDLAIIAFAFALGAYYCSIELHRRFLGTVFERILPQDFDGEFYRVACFSIGCKLSLAAVLVCFLPLMVV